MKQMRNILTSLLCGIFIKFSFCQSTVTKTRVNIWCIKKNQSELTFRIENLSAKSFFVPDDFSIRYSNEQDTIYFEGMNTGKITQRAYFYYNKFDGVVTTAKAIKGVKADSVIYIQSAVKVNEFHLPKLIELKPNGIMVKTVKFRVPQGANKAVFTLYKSNSAPKDVAEFMKFSRYNSILFSSDIFETVSR